MKAGIRLDQLVVQNGLSPSREQAKSLIMAGEIYVNGQKEDKPGSMFPADAPVEHRGKALPYVSRGGLKLEKALRVFPISLEGAVCVDIGASTGGVTDCMLQNGASKVYALDVGYGQLAYKLRMDPRVVSLEKTNIRYTEPETLGEPCDFASVDVSFISLSLVLGPMYRLLRPGGQAVCLVKPQFEAGREKVGRKGVIRDPLVHREVLEKAVSLAGAHRFRVLGLDCSPIKGPEGNIEFLMHLEKAEEPQAEDFAEEIRRLVDRAHREL
ncbi:MAG: TlyA family RNA methyltransferase [Lachnospiraceae bacterium]|nr:TlyA family RNA methyltransferase [Lachnospiraceae bacterium]